MGGKTISTSDTRIETLALQSSAYGVVIPLAYGVCQIAGNLIDYVDFKAIPHTTSTSGKGGGGSSNTTFSYTASVMMGLCEGQITGISRIWKGKQLFAGGISPGQLLTATESFTVSPGVPVTVAQGATFASNSLVLAGTGVANVYALALEVDYWIGAGGVYTFPAFSGPCEITYQYVLGGGSQTALQALGLSLAAGALGQAAWPYLATNFPPQAIGYSGLAYVYGRDYPLASDASVDNHIFEVQGPQAFGISAAIPDANPSQVAADVLLNGRYGAGFPSSQLAPLGPWSDYCLASGLFVSPAIETQMKCGDFMALMGQLTNTAPVWTGGQLKMIPYGDAAISGNGASYTPDVTPIYDLGDDDYAPSSGGDPILVERLPQADAFNHIRVEFLNRANAYNIEIAEAKDSANIDAFGLRSADILQAHWICDAAIARQVAQLVLQRTLYIRNTYTFTLTWVKALLEPMDLVTLTDSGLLFDKLPVRITEIDESDTGDLAVTAEDFPVGVATAALYPSQQGVGYQHDYNAAPGAASVPLIFEAPGALTVNGLELYIATTGVISAKWGGCNVWVSLDGTNYKLAGTLNGGSRYGSLTNAPGPADTISVEIFSGGLASGSAADAAALNTLCYIGGDTPEYFAFQNATLLTTALHYDLTGNVRGAYGTAAATHAFGDGFVRVDTGIARSGPIDLGYVGKTIHVKLTSFNIYGMAEESLADVSDYTYVVTGAQILGNAGAAALHIGGPQGEPGPAGADGRTTYFHVAYANDAGGGGFNQDGGLYIGTYVDFTPTDSTDPAAYTWVLVKGAQGDAGTNGIPGTNGATGQTSYLHIKYSDDGGASFTGADGETVGKYIGTYVDFTLADSDNPAAYTWAQIRGADGASGPQGNQGTPGTPGANGASAFNWVLNGTALDGATVVKTMGVDGWDTGNAYSVESFVGGAYVSFQPNTLDSDVFCGLSTAPSADQSYDRVDLAWYVSVATAQIAIAGQGSENRTVTTDTVLSIVYDNASARFFEGAELVRTVAVGPGVRYFVDAVFYGAGDSIKNVAFGSVGSSTYFHVAYANDASGGGFNQTGGTYIGTYVDTTPTDSGDPAAYKWVLIAGSPGSPGTPGSPGAQGPAGTNGIPGVNGADGQTSYLHIKYSNDGGSTFTTNAGEDVGAWIGTYVDFTLADSTSVGSYTWARLNPPTYRQESTPTGTIPEGSLWLVPSTGKQYVYVGGVWYPSVGVGSVDSGSLAGGAATEVTVFFDAAGVSFSTTT